MGTAWKESNMPLEQASRSLKLHTPLGENKLLLTAFQGQEEMSRLFEFDLEMISDDNAISARDLVGKNVTFSIERGDGSQRYFNGFVSRFAAGDEDDEGRRNYRARVVPWLWFLTRTSDCRIFQKKKIPDIVEQIFGDLGFSDFDRSKLKGAHPQWEYCVQYRETDFQFVSRLLEQEGIYYFFKHEQGKHTLVLADQKTGYEKCAEGEVDFPRDSGSAAVADHVTCWEHAYEFRTGKWAHTDFNFETPSKSLMTTEQTVVSLPGVDKYECYDYPGQFGTTADGAPLAKARMEEEELGYDMVQGDSTCKSFCPGYKFSVGQHRSDSEMGTGYVLTAVRHWASEPLGYETGGGHSGPVYRNSFVCIPDSVVFRPARITAKPVMRGCQTAIVTGPRGEEIYPDKYGRVKVQFHWDREGKRDENSSCWIRVSQVHAGKGWGMMLIPRVGEEVIVDFLEGDPDRPIIVGRVYHAENMPPYELPSSKNLYGLKSNSTQGGGGFNEYVFDDTKGSELIREHGQYDKESVIEHDLRNTIHNNRTDQIDVDDSETVGNNQQVSIGNNQTISVGNNRALKVGNNQNVEVGNNRTLTVAENRSASVGGDDDLTVSGAQKIGVSGAIEISSDTSITLTVGGSSIKIEPASVSIKSVKVTVEGEAMIESKAPMITSQADAINEVKGAMVKLN
jgi:type VI secretion system secreted protein VgrG